MGIPRFGIFAQSLVSEDFGVSVENGISAMQKSLRRREALQAFERLERVRRESGTAQINREMLLVFWFIAIFLAVAF